MCRYLEISDIDPRVLRPRTRIGSHYVVGKLLFQPGGFGMTYKGWNLASGNIVAIKEYFPRSVADRAADGINVRATDEKLFEYGLVRFEDEAQQLLMLRNVDHVVNVHGYFEENSTAYIVMEYYDGCNLSEYIKINNGSLSEPQVKSILFDLAGALGKVHALGYLHRDIKPSNIYITKDIVPILLDFGSARFAVSEKNTIVERFVHRRFCSIRAISNAWETGAMDGYLWFGGNSLFRSHRCFSTICAGSLGKRSTTATPCACSEYF